MCVTSTTYTHIMCEFTGALCVHEFSPKVNQTKLDEVEASDNEERGSKRLNDGYCQL